MPMKSQAQRAFLHIHHPKIAKRWEKHTPKDKRLPKHVQKEGDDAEGFEVAEPVSSDSLPIDLDEMPHFETNDSETIDLQIERWPISNAEKAKILKIIDTTGIVAKDESEWRFFSPDNRSDVADANQVRRLPKLPNTWKKYAKVEQCTPSMTVLYKKR